MDESDAEWWQQIFNASVYETMEQLRDAVDEPDWRERDVARSLIEGRKGDPPREVHEQFGSVRGRQHRQVNVKLAQPDFDVLEALAIERDLPPSSLARVLLRRALLDEAG